MKLVSILELGVDCNLETVMIAVPKPPGLWHFVKATLESTSMNDFKILISYTYALRPSASARKLFIEDSAAISWS